VVKTTPISQNATRGTASAWRTSPPHGQDSPAGHRPARRRYWRRRQTEGDFTGDTLADQKPGHHLSAGEAPPSLPSPSPSKPKSRNDEDRMGNASPHPGRGSVVALLRDPQTREFPPGRLRPAARRNRGQPVEEALRAWTWPSKLPKIPYRETVRGNRRRPGPPQEVRPAAMGQFGDCWIKMEPPGARRQVRVLPTRFSAGPSPETSSRPSKRAISRPPTTGTWPASHGGLQGDRLRRLLP